ncbi:hypothetical protein [Haloarchaeobius iranensis]|uniref:ParB-like nuclease domain-containing protein n=1 Tax=Haloarchaeobius iranensis TaxID=996166 RepID=A0A1G9UZG5_9EURY|nr:hypothetical protein [Haloarchaeobius iranensis]SDM65362.1 hypothetical protein SAMN05192554_105100 [Haloarchaeobius iranensis]
MSEVHTNCKLWLRRTRSRCSPRDSVPGRFPACNPFTDHQIAVPRLPPRPPHGRDPLPLDEPQPSQPYLNRGKLDGVLSWFDPDEPDYDPLPVIERDGEWALIDGHTRAFGTSLAGADELRVVHDTDDHPRELYGRCVEWCRDVDITTVADLHSRLVSEGAYERLWLDRCQRAAAEGGG